MFEVYTCVGIPLKIQLRAHPPTCDDNVNTKRILYTIFTSRTENSVWSGELTAPPSRPASLPTKTSKRPATCACSPPTAWTGTTQAPLDQI